MKFHHDRTKITFISKNKNPFVRTDREIDCWAQSNNFSTMESFVKNDCYFPTQNTLEPAFRTEELKK